jgi:MFS family permease
VRPVRASFFTFGFFWGTWAVVALDVQRFLGFSDAGLGLLLAATVVGGVLANGAGGILAERLGTRTLLSGALVLWGALLLGVAATTNEWAFCLLFLATVAGGGLVDVVMNVAGTAALGSDSARLLRLHALFNAGALAGAATAGILLERGFGFRAIWAGVAIAAFVLALWCRVTDLPAGERGEHYTVREGLASLRATGLATVAVVFAIGAVVEGGIGTWGVLFLRANLGLAVVAGAAAYVAGQGLATAARCSLGWTTSHLGDRRGAQWGLALAGAGLLVEATANNNALAAIGLGAAAVGVSIYWPLLLAFASRGSTRPGLVVGGLSACGYVGFLAGPPVVGWIAQATDLRWGIGVLAAAAFAGAVVRIRAPRVSPIAVESQPGSKIAS